MVKITNNSYMEIKSHYDDVLNKDRASFKSSNDEPTPTKCIEEMIKKIPKELWKEENMKILDPVCGNGNFHSVIYNKLKDKFSPKQILENILYFNDIDLNRTLMINTIFESSKYDLNVTTQDYLEYNESQQFDLIVANPPYAKLFQTVKEHLKIII